MALLDDIPTEIIQQIFKLLPKADLASLCLTNHSNRHHAEPCLYSTINFRGSASEKPPIILLLRTLLSRPELFALIDTFSLVGYAPLYRMFSDELRLPIPSNVSLSQFISAIEKTKAPYIDIWVMKLENCEMDAFAGLLIAYLSNTTSLTITTNFIVSLYVVAVRSDDEAVESDTRSHGSGATSHQSDGEALEPDSDEALESDSWETVESDSDEALEPDVRSHKSDGEALDPNSEEALEYDFPNAYDKRLDTNETYQDQDSQFEEAISTLYLPNLVDVKFWLANPERFWWPEGKPNLHHLTSLDIEWLHPRLLKKILSLTRNLRSLAYSWDYVEDISRDAWKDSDLNLDKIITAISPTKHTLEKLHVKFRVGFGIMETWPEVSTSGSFDNLVEFDQVKELHVPFVALYGFHANYAPLGRGIPPSVETLILTDDMMDDATFVMWFARKPDMRGWGEDLKAWGESRRIWGPGHTLQSVILLLAESCPTKFPRLRQILWFNLSEDDYSDYEREVERISRLLGVDIKPSSVEMDEREMQYFDRHREP
ncbi:hypothetical protein V2G26_019961 [Clonostachys chloroleuca]